MTLTQYTLLLVVPNLLGMGAFAVVIVYLVNRVHELEEVMSGDR